MLTASQARIINIFNRIWVRFPAALRRREKSAIRIFRFGSRSTFIPRPLAAGFLISPNNMVTLDQALDTAMQLPPDEQEMLIQILHNRRIESRREEIAQDAKASVKAFHAGQLKSQTAEEAISELRQFLNDVKDQ
jgi:hypothetical protein